MAATDLEVRKAFSRSEDEAQAVADLAKMIGATELSGLIFFCSSRYNRYKLASELESTFDGPIVGCTTAGEISPIGYLDGGLSAVGLLGDALSLHPRVLSPLSEISEQAKELRDSVNARLETAREHRDVNAVGFLLVDGLSVMEEQVMAHISNALAGIPLVGGSAGDDMGFEKTHVYANGAFHSDAAVFTLVETTLPFTTFRTQHFVETDKKMVVTGADSERRVVTEINGGPAAWEYAREIGLEVEELEPQIFSKYPVMLRIGGEYYVRSIQKVNEDGSLTFFCAIDEGLVLTIAQGVDLVENLEEALEKVREEIPQPRLILGCDCILRKLEMKEKGLLDRVGAIMNENNVIGFSTYGEQIGSVHVNQTFTGIVIG